MKERGDSWVQVAIYVLWIATAISIVGFLYVVIHFIRKFW